MRKLIFLFASALQLYATSEDYPFRDLDRPIFPLDKNVRVVLASPPRTGSTLIYNVLAYLFEDKNVKHTLSNLREKRVIKTHNFNRMVKASRERFDCYFVTTMREKAAIMASVDRVLTCTTPERRKRALMRTAETIDKFQKWQRAAFPMRTLVLNYEDFNDNFPHIFETLEDFFGIAIPEDEKVYIETTFCREAMQELSKKYSSFHSFDAVTGIHGDHIK